MHRFLIVEDELEVLGLLVAPFMKAFPGCEVDSARTIDDALELIRKSLESARWYDVAVLDFRLPRAINRPLEIDTSLCQAVTRWMPDVPVLHITSHKDEPGVQEHLRLSHSSIDAPKMVLIDKGQWDWVDRLVKEARGHINSTSVGAKMNKLFGDERQRTGLERQVRRNGYVTHELRALTTQLEQVWPTLHEHVQARVLKHFERRSDHDGDHFTLIIPESTVQ